MGKDSKKKDSQDEGVSSLPSSGWGRTSRLVKLTASIGASTISQKVSQAFSDDSTKRIQKTIHLAKQAQKIVETLGEMKGAAMKLGQILSLHGDSLFPKEVTQILSQLQSQAPFMAFSEIEKILIGELGQSYSERLLDFSKKPIAAASIGQVHKASLEDGTWVAVKVQYPGVKDSIDSDIQSLATLLKLVSLVPSSESFDAIIEEIRELLHQETDYLEEGANLEEFRAYFKDESDLIIPQYFREHSTSHILTTEFVRAQSVQEFQDEDPSQDARNSLGKTFMKVFFKELFERGAVQTDPNFGNYKILSKDRKLVLLDFGAVKKFSGEWRAKYIQMIRSCYLNQAKDVLEISYELGFLRPDDSDECKQIHLDICELFLEPFRAPGEYDFAASQLPQRMRAQIPRIIAAFALKAPPKNILFLNRKMIGTYFFLSAIGARISTKQFLDPYM